MRSRIIPFAIALALLASPVAAEVKNICTAPENLAQLDIPLPHTAARLAAKQPVTIVAIGSSSTAGAGASAPANTYPSRLVIALVARFPEADIKVLNRGVNGEIERQMEARFDRDVLAEHPDLVIWQVGTNSVLRDNDITGYQAALEHGIARLKTSGADVVIMDLQYAPRVLSHPTYEDMLRKIAIAARDGNVPLFHRFAIMQNWIKSGRLDFATMLSPDQLHLNDLSYRCIANVLAGSIGDAIEAPPMPNVATTARAITVADPNGKKHDIDLLPVKSIVDATLRK